MHVQAKIYKISSPTTLVNIQNGCFTGLLRVLSLGMRLGNAQSRIWDHNPSCTGQFMIK